VALERQGQPKLDEVLGTSRKPVRRQAHGLVFPGTNGHPVVRHAGPVSTVGGLASTAHIKWDVHVQRDAAIIYEKYLKSVRSYSHSRIVS